MFNTALCTDVCCGKKERHNICLTPVIHVVQCLFMCMLFVCLLQHVCAGADSSLPTLHSHGVMILARWTNICDCDCDAQPEAAEGGRKKEEK